MRQTANATTVFQYEWVAIDIDSQSSQKNILLIDSAGASIKTIEAGLKSAGHTVDISALNAVTLKDKGYDRIVLVAGIEPPIENCLTLQRLIHQVSEAELQEVPSIVILTQQVFPAINAELSAAGAMLWGMARTMRNEYPELGGMVIDSPSLDDKKIIHLITTDALSYGKEFSMADGVIFEPRLKVAPVVSNSDDTMSISPTACFMVSGGTSGLGLAYAEWLAGQGCKKIALVSRSGEKPETQEAVERMTGLGAQVRVFKADISHADGVKELIASVAVSLGDITGVVHAAGLVDDTTLNNLSKEQFEAVAAAKVTGTKLLHEAFSDQQLTHFIVFFKCSHRTRNRWTSQL